MRSIEAAPLAERTTLRLGGPAARLVEAETETELVDTVGELDTAGEPLLVLGGGSNLVVADAGFPGTVVAVRHRGIEVDSDSRGGVVVRVAAGEVWDDLVVRAVESGWVGVEALSGIPGLVGAAPIQNVGAYGQEVSHTIVSVRTLDRRSGDIRTLAAADCGFGYRSSRFKSDPTASVVLSVTFRLGLGDLGTPVEYAELARTLGVDPGERVDAATVRATVLRLRAGKGMVLDPVDHDTWSAGSFFTNPLLDPEQAAGLPAAAPRWRQSDGTVKTSAAWLIGHAGYAAGHGNKAVSLSHKHTLALTNRGSATTEQLLTLAREVRDGVRERFGIELVNEPVTVGCSL